MAEKARTWWGVCYPENMIKNWKSEIDDILQLPYCYALHDCDVCEEVDARKDHIHLIIVFPNTTTYKNALNLINKLSLPGKKCCNKIESVINIRHCYNYLIHDTENCRKKRKYLYPKNSRVEGNCFDIGCYEQVSAAEKNKICQELCQDIVQYSFKNFIDFYNHVLYTHQEEFTLYFEVVKGYSGLFERMCKGNYQKGKPKD